MRIKLGFEAHNWVADVGPLDEFDSSIDGRVIVEVDFPDVVADRILMGRAGDVMQVAELGWQYMSDEAQDQVDTLPLDY